MKRVLWIPVLLLSLSAAVEADVVHLVDGRRIEGQVRKAPGGDLFVKGSHGELRVAAADVDRVDERQLRRKKRRVPNKIKARVARDRRARARRLDKADKAVKRIEEKLDRALATERSARENLTRACLQELHTNTERRAAAVLRAKEAEVERTRARLESAKKLYDRVAIGCRANCCECTCDTTDQENAWARVLRYEERLGLREREREDAATALHEAIEPTRVAHAASLLRLAQRRVRQAQQDLRAARRERARVGAVPLD